MKAKLCMEDCRPMLFWLVDDEGRDLTKPFFMGQIKEKIDNAKGFGYEVEVPDEIKDFL